MNFSIVKKDSDKQVKAQTPEYYGGPSLRQQSYWLWVHGK